MAKWEEFIVPKEKKPKSLKQRLDKNRFCRKNVIAPKTFGPHLYKGSNICSLCKHIKKDRRRPY